MTGVSRRKDHGTQAGEEPSVTVLFSSEVVIDRNMVEEGSGPHADT